MNAFLRPAIAFAIAGFLPLISYAGTEQQASKEVAAVAPPSCEWGGFYLGASVGGQFGHSEDKDLDNYNFPDRPWGYHEDGVVASEQMGFNWQFGHLVLGPEIEAGYMNLKGRGIEPGFPQDTFGESKSDIFTTFRGRIGVAFDGWLLYGTGGGIGVNYTTSVVDTSFTAAGPDTIDAHREHFEWGYTVGGGVERMFKLCDHRWSVKVEYLFFNIGNQSFSAVSGNQINDYHWHGDTEGHIVRAGLNYHF